MTVGLYDSAYSNFEREVFEVLRQAMFDEDVGQTGWLTAEEWRRFFELAAIGAESHVLDVGSGSGGPGVYMVELIGCRLTGLETNEAGVNNGNSLAEKSGVADRAKFIQGDATEVLPFEENTFDTVICIDAINHLPGRPRVLAEWYRVLRPGGRCLFTDPITVTGMLTHEEIRIRSSIGYFVFTPLPVDEELIRRAGFRLELRGDVTHNMELVSTRWHDAREERQADLRKIEGDETYECTQEFLSVVRTLATERRLSRFVYVAVKPEGGAPA